VIAMNGSYSESVRTWERGVSLVEVIIVTALMFAIAGVVSQLTLRTHQAQRYAEKSVQLTGLTQELIELVRKDVSGSTRFFVGDAEGISYWGELDLSMAPPYTWQLPVLDTDGIFEKDSLGNVKTGNALFFALLERSDTFDAGDLTPHVVRIDIFRFVAYYLRRTDGGDPKGSSSGLDLVKWVSQPVADLAQVEEVTDPDELKRLFLHFYAGSNPLEPEFPYPPVRYLWKQSEPIATAFKEILYDGSLNDLDPASWNIPIDPSRSTLGLLEAKGYGIASNQAGEPRGIAAFGLRDDSSLGFPHGFETQIVGPASARQILLHLTTVSTRSPETRCWGNITGIAETRDL
jgi:type II secretory pathway pseudopilin PulG